MKMKKLLIILMATVLLIGMSACSGKKTEEKVLRVGMECAYAPYNWTQADDSNGAVQIHDSSDYANGYDVQMAKYLADKIGYKLEIYKMEWTSLPTAVQTGTIDCAIAGQSITAERLETMDFTTPYYYASIVALTKNDSAFASAAGLSELDGAVCTSQMGTVWYDVCLPQIPNAQILPAMEATSDMLVSLESGKCDILVLDMPSALASVVAYPDMKLLDFTSNTADNFEVSDEEINIGISVQKGNSDLLTKLNEALATLTTDDFSRMMNEAIANQPLSQ
jgi:putative lysine transport system substrate-binding protein